MHDLFYVDNELPGLLAENLRLQALVQAQLKIHQLETQNALSNKLGNILIQGVDSLGSLLSVPGKIGSIWRESTRKIPPKALGGKGFDKVISVYDGDGFDAVERLLAEVSSPIMQANAYTALARHLLKKDRVSAAEAARRAHSLDPKLYRLKWLAFRLYEAGDIIQAEAMLNILPADTSFSDSDALEASCIRKEAKQAWLREARKNTALVEYREYAEQCFENLKHEYEQKTRLVKERDQEIEALKQAKVQLEQEKQTLAGELEAQTRLVEKRCFNIEQRFDDIIKKYNLKETLYSTRLHKELKICASRIDKAIEQYQGKKNIIAISLIDHVYFLMKKFNYLKSTVDYIFYRGETSSDSDEQAEFFESANTKIVAYSRIGDCFEAKKIDLLVIVTPSSELSKWFSSTDYEKTCGLIPQIKHDRALFRSSLWSVYEITDNYILELKNTIDSDQKAQLLQLIMGIVLYAKDFVAFGDFATDYINNKYPDWENYQSAVREFSELIKEAAVALARNNCDNILLTFWDAMRYDYLDEMPYLREFSKNSFCFDNFYSTSGFTRQSFYGLYTGKLSLFEDFYKSIPLEKMKWMSYLKKSGYKIVLLATNTRSASILKQDAYDDKIYNDSLILKPAAATQLYTIINDMLLKCQKCVYLLHNMPETHNRASGYLPDISRQLNKLHENIKSAANSEKPFLFAKSFSKYSELISNGVAHLDRIFSMYLPVFNYNHTILIITADHGRNGLADQARRVLLKFYNYFNDEAYHIPFIIHSNKIKPEKYCEIMSHNQMYDILKKLVERKTDFEKIDFVLISDVPAYGNTFSSCLETLSLKERSDTKICGVVTVRTDEDKYCLNGDGSESYYINPYDICLDFDLINIPKYWERINVLRKNLEPDLWERFFKLEQYKKIVPMWRSEEVLNMHFLEFIVALARETGRLIRDEWGGVQDVELKPDGSPVTNADKMAGEYICRQIRDKYRVKYPILCEETTDDLSRLDSDYCFIVDPIDGTKGFIAGNNEYTVNIALSYKGEPVVGVVYAPATDDLFMAAKHIGAFRSKDGGERQKIRCSERTVKLRMARSRNHPDPREDELAMKHGIIDFVTSGSSLKGCLVAAGECDVYYRYGETSEWDTAAMQCIVEQAGGIFRQLDGSKMYYNREDTRNRNGFCAVNWEENLWVENTCRISERFDTNGLLKDFE
jgi:3'(2'),5'-bisphosphate nucleotidase